tara:strand:- start:703 stop:906 length:204 start_codon:yes stop_codon:yes gene_type:complete
MADIDKLLPRNMLKKNKELLRKAIPILQRKLKQMKKEEPEMIKFSQSGKVDLNTMFLTWLAGKGHIK